MLLRLDAIGDYLLFRESFRKIRFAERYAERDFVFCGNMICQDLFQTFDHDLTQETLWIDRNKFLRNFLYRFSVQSKIRKLGIEIVAEPTHSRMYLLGDSIVRCSGAAEKIADSGNADNSIPKEKKIADSWFDALISTGEEIIFERERNFIFAEKLTFEKFSREILFLPLPPKKRENVIILFIGASENYKIWHYANFALVAKKLFNRFGSKIILAGGKAETEIAEKLMRSEQSTPFTDLTGKTKLPELAELIAGAKLLITNETAAVHFGAYTNTLTLCIANGRHFGRFSPYTADFTHVRHIFPPKVEAVRKDFKVCAQTFCNSAGENINEIKAETVFRIALEMLEEKP